MLVRHDPGTNGSTGAVAANDNRHLDDIMPPDAERVRFAADYILAHRRITDLQQQQHQAEHWVYDHCRHPAGERDTEPSPRQDGQPAGDGPRVPHRRTPQGRRNPARRLRPSVQRPATRLPTSRDSTGALTPTLRRSHAQRPPTPCRTTSSATRTPKGLPCPRAIRPCRSFSFFPPTASLAQHTPGSTEQSSTSRQHPSATPPPAGIHPSSMTGQSRRAPAHHAPAGILPLGPCTPPKLGRATTPRQQGSTRPEIGADSYLQSTQSTPRQQGCTRPSKAGEHFPAVDPATAGIHPASQPASQPRASTPRQQRYPADWCRFLPRLTVHPTLAGRRSEEIGT